MSDRKIRFRRRDLDCFDVIEQERLDKLDALVPINSIATFSQDYVAELSKDWDNPAHKAKTMAAYINKARHVLRSCLPRHTWKEIERHQKKGHLDMQQLFAVTDFLFDQIQEQKKADTQ